MFYSVDAIEGGLARLVDDGETVLCVPLARLPAGTRETDVLTWQNGAYALCPEEAEARRQYAAQLLRDILQT